MVIKYGERAIRSVRSYELSRKKTFSIDKYTFIFMVGVWHVGGRALYQQTGIRFYVKKADSLDEVSS